MIAVLEEDWGLGWPDNNSIEKVMRSHLEYIQNYTPPDPKTQYNSTVTSFWLDLINEDLKLSPPKPPEPPQTHVIGKPVKRGYGGFCNE